jgi:D-alanine--poly(phosphoribitol) ligase subunit 2
VKIIETITKSPGPFPGDESLFDSGVLDSFALPELVMALEQAFSIKIPDSDLNADTFESVDKISSYVQRQS